MKSIPCEINEVRIRADLTVDLYGYISAAVGSYKETPINSILTVEKYPGL